MKKTPAELAKALATDWNTVYRADTIAALERLERVLDAHMPDAHCPCCNEIETCAPDCTFAADCPGEAATMQRIRELLA